MDSGEQPRTLQVEEGVSSTTANARANAVSPRQGNIDMTPTNHSAEVSKVDNRRRCKTNTMAPATEKTHKDTKDIRQHTGGENEGDVTTSDPPTYDDRPTDDASPAGFDFHFASLGSNSAEELYDRQQPTQREQTTTEMQEKHDDKKEQVGHAVEKEQYNKRRKTSHALTLSENQNQDYSRMTQESSTKKMSPQQSSSLLITAGADIQPPTPVSTQSFSWNDIIRVQNLIERCLQQYLCKAEIVTALRDQAKIEPEFTNVVWQKLEEQNPAFFRAYKLQLKLKEQIIAFNFLTSQQKQYVASMNASSRAKSLNDSINPMVSTLPSIQSDDRSFVHAPMAGTLGVQVAPIPYNSQTTEGKRPVYANLNQAGGGNSAGASSFSFSSQCPPPSPLPLPSPIKTDLDTHAFFT